MVADQDDDDDDDDDDDEPSGATLGLLILPSRIKKQRLKLFISETHTFASHNPHSSASVM